MFVFMILCALAIVFTVASKKNASDDGAVTVFGYQLRTVLTGSMEASEHTNVDGYDIGSIPTGSLILVKTAPEDPEKLNAWYENDVKPGDVLTFRYSGYGLRQVTITHRVIDKQPIDGGYIISLEGDNKSDSTNPGVQTIDTTKRTGSGDYIIGEVVANSLVVGKAMNFVKSPAGIILLIMVPCFFIILFEVIKIIKISKKDKKEEIEKATADKDGEIEELRKQLEALQKQAATQQVSEQSTEKVAETSTEEQNDRGSQAEVTDSTEITEDSEK